MYFRQIIREDIGCASYLVGSTDESVAVVVDPRLDMVDEILSLAQQKGLRITHIIETHNHADHVSGHGPLAERTGARIYIHPAANAEYPHEDLEDGARLEIGEVVLEAMHTPGHRPEHLALTVADTSRAEEPWLVLTGDSLFIGDVARPDLAVPGREGAELLHRSLFERLLKLSDGVEVYPAHVAGSLCGRVTNLKASSTIGFERRHNPALEPRPVEQFVEYMNESLPQRPPNMSAIVEANRTGTQTPHPVARPLPVEELARLAASGHVVLDTRPPGSFSAGHVPGAINVDAGAGQFGTRVGFVIPSGARLLLVLQEDTGLKAVLDGLAVVAYGDVTGYLAGGMAAWTAAGMDILTVPELSAQELSELLEGPEPVGVLDVREDSEWEAGHIPNAIHVPFHQVQANLNSIPDGPIAVVCGSGQRSSIAAGILQRAGRNDVETVAGGMSAWNGAGYPVTTS